MKKYKNNKEQQRITKTKSFINKYHCKGTHFPSEKDDWKKFEQNKVTIALNILYARKEIHILLMFENINQTRKKIHSFNDFKRRKMALPFSQKTQHY